ncbi:MAG: hypothetical protein ABR583_01170 [Gaiellaceae bacterium]
MLVGSLLGPLQEAGIVAKPRSGTYRPGEREWIKVKNRGYWRFSQELELAQSRRGSAGDDLIWRQKMRYPL